jgi:tRNA U34 5-carboxymethylaminomethyl modifying GTPase MnmE/TrmE
MDTAGFNEGSENLVEKIGIGKSWKVLEEAKVAVFVVSFEDLSWADGGFWLDAGSGNYKFLLENLERFGADPRVMILVNKIDLLFKIFPKRNIGPLIAQLRGDQLPSIQFCNTKGKKVSIAVAAVTSFVDRDSWLLGNCDSSLEMTVNGFLGECQSKVLGLIESRLESVGTGDVEGADLDSDLFVANSRQLLELENCLGNLKEFERCLGMDPEEMDWSAVNVERMGEEGGEVRFDVGIQILRDAIRNLGAILGKGLMEEEILDQIFDNFCIGK